MRRSSTKKSSMFKIQADKNIYKNFLNNINNCVSVQKHPHLLPTIRQVSETVYDYCFNFSQETPFLKGMNYGCRNYGISFPSTYSILIKQWIPNAKQVYLMGDFNHFDELSHPMTVLEEQQNVYAIQLNISDDHVADQSRIILRIIDNEGKQHRMPPPSCKIQSEGYGYVCIEAGLPVVKNQKGNDIMIAYTIDFLKISIHDSLNFINDHETQIKLFNTIILRNLFTKKTILDRATLDLQTMKTVKQLISKLKHDYHLKVIIQWSFTPGTLRYGLDNPIQKQLLKACPQQNLYHYNLDKEQPKILYIANLSYFLSVLQIDGFHFKHIDSLCRSKQGQVIVKCLNIMNQRHNQNGYTLASCKKQVPGLNQPILQGGLGFTFTYNCNEDFMRCRNSNELKLKFDKILQSSNCVAIDLQELTKQNQLNFIFAVFVSKKGVFCKGSFQGKQQILKKILNFRRQPQLFENSTKLTLLSDKVLVASRGKTQVIFNFSSEIIQQKIQGIQKKQLLMSFVRNGSEIINNSIRLNPFSCSVISQ